MAKVTGAGYIARTLPEIIADLTALFKGVYGNDISVAPDTQDGQFIGILAQMFADYEELGASIYRQLDPSSATGRWLEQRAAYVGVYRDRGTSSTLPAVQINGAASTPVPNGFTVTDANSIRWIIATPATIGPDNFVYANFYSEEKGSYLVPPGTDMKTSIQIPGITSVVSTVPVVEGSNRDSDPMLRNNMLVRKLGVSSNVCTRITDALTKVQGVGVAIAYENVEDTPDSVGSPPHSIWCIVDGGDSTDVAVAILNTKTGGAKLRGEVKVTVIDDDGIPRPIAFDRFTPVAIEARLAIVRSEGVISVDVASIEKALLDYKPQAGEDVYISRVYSIVNETPGFWIRELLIGKVGNTPAANNVIIGPQEVVRFTKVDITME